MPTLQLRAAGGRGGRGRGGFRGGPHSALAKHYPCKFFTCPQTSPAACQFKADECANQHSIKILYQYPLPQRGRGGHHGGGGGRGPPITALDVVSATEGLVFCQENNLLMLGSGGPTEPNWQMPGVATCVASSDRWLFVAYKATVTPAVNKLHATAVEVGMLAAWDKEAYPYVAGKPSPLITPVHDRQDPADVKPWAHRQPIRAIEIVEGLAPDHIAFTGGEDGDIKAWMVDRANAPNFICKQLPDGHVRAVSALRYVAVNDRHSELLVSGGDDRATKVWDLRTWTCLHTIMPPSALAAVAPLAGPGAPGGFGRFAAMQAGALDGGAGGGGGGGGGRGALKDEDREQVVSVCDFFITDEAEAAAAAAAGREPIDTQLLCVGYRSGEICLHVITDVSDSMEPQTVAAPIHRVQPGSTAPLTAMLTIYIEEHPTLITGHSDGSIFVRDIQTGCGTGPRLVIEELPAGAGHSSGAPITHLSVMDSEDGQFTMLSSASADGRIVIWKLCPSGDEAGAGDE